MVIAIVIYKFELNQNSNGEISPEFKALSSGFSQENREIELSKLITTNDQFGLFFNHTTGMSTKNT